MEELRKQKSNTITFKEFEEICERVQSNAFKEKEKEKPAVLKMISNIGSAMKKKEPNSAVVNEKIVVNSPILNEQNTKSNPSSNIQQKVEKTEERKEEVKQIRVTIMDSSEISTCARALHLWGYIVKFNNTKVEFIHVTM